jgi:hypothetical protein
VCPLSNWNNGTRRSIGAAKFDATATFTSPAHAAELNSPHNMKNKEIGSRHEICIFNS